MTYERVFQFPDHLSGPCPECDGEGFFVELYGGYGNYDGAPNEREITCSRCDGTGELEGTCLWVGVDDEDYVYILSEHEIYFYTKVLGYGK